MDAFVPYGGLHALALAVCAVLIAAPAVIGRALDRNLDQNGELILRRALAALAVCYWVAYNTWWNWHGLDPRTGLPLQICDFNGLIAPLAFLTGWRFARATLYFWTAALTLQAFIQPTLTAGPASLLFWFFWAAHTLIAACAVYDIAVLGYRPCWSDLGRALIVSAAYVALVVPINLWLGSDYGYLGNPAAVSEIPPFVYALGPWPQRAFILVALAPPGFIAVLLPWLIFGAGQKTEPPGNRPGSAPSVRSAHSEARALSPHARRAITSANPGRTPAFGADGRHLWHADIALRSRAPCRGAGAAPESPGSTKV